jgi:hypothetical protein
MKSVAALTSGINVSAAYHITKHYLRFIEDPIVKTNVTGELTVSLTNMTMTFHERLPIEGPYTGMSFLQIADVFDSDVLHLTSLVDKLKNPPTSVINMLTDTLHPLAPDLVGPIGFNDASIVQWINTAWMLVKQSQLAEVEFNKTGVEATVKVPAIAHTATLRGDAGIAGVGDLPGYPLVSQFDPTINWTDTQYGLWTLEIPPQCWTTREAVRDKIAQHPFMPVRIRGSINDDPQALKVQMLPYSTTFSEGGTYHPITLESIGRLWNCPIRYLNDLMIALGTDTSQGLWRSFATSLQFIGQISINGITVVPHVGHWYHAKTFNEGCFGPPLQICAQPLVVLKPFRFIPLSCDITTFAATLAQVQDGITLPSLPFLQWILDTEAAPSRVAIDGWITSEPLRDLVLIPTVPPTYEYELTTNYDVGPYSAHKYNAVISVFTPPTVSPPPVVPVPELVLTSAPTPSMATA